MLSWLQCGEIKEVRLIKNREGRSKGFAYIEFTDEVRQHLLTIAIARATLFTSLKYKPCKSTTTVYTVGPHYRLSVHNLLSGYLLSSEGMCVEIFSKRSLR